MLYLYEGITWAFSNCIWSFTFYIVHTCTITIKIVVFVYNHNYLYEDVMPAFPTYFFLFHVTFGMLFLLIFCILTEVKLYNLFPQLLEILGIHCNENNIQFLRYLIIHIHTYIVRYAYKYAYGTYSMVQKYNLTHKSL